MKKLILGFAVLFSLSVSAQNLNTPAASPTQTITQDFALSSIEVKYSRPAMKGRTIFGGLVPYDAMWRLGANSPTTFRFGEDVTVGGKDVKAGIYSVLAIPGKSEWEIILAEKGTSVFNFKEENEVVRFSVPVNNVPFEVENFTVMLSDQTANSVNIEFIWENTYVDIPVTAEIESKIMTQIDEVMNKDTKPYFAAASYYLANDKDNDKALEWALKASEAQPEAYWVKHALAKIQAKAGDKAAAKATAKISMKLAEKAGNMDYVRLNEGLLKTL